MLSFTDDQLALGGGVILGGGLVLALISPFVIAIYNIYFHGLSSYPGPKIAAATRLWSMSASVSGSLTHEVCLLHEKYGDVIRIGPNELSYNTADAWKEIYGHRSGKPEMLKDSTFYSQTSSGADSIISTTRDRHSHLRRHLAHGFSDSALREQETDIQRYADLLIKRLHERGKLGQEPIDLEKWYNYFTFDIISDLTFSQSQSFGCLESSSYHPWVAMIFDSLKAAAWFRAANNYPIIAKLMQYFIPAELVARRNTHRELAKAKALHRKGQKSERADLMHRMVPPSAGVLPHEFIATANTLIIAGSETTATLLSAATFFLLMNPSSMAKLVEEVRSSFTEEKEIDFVKIGHLKYMLACLDESLRIFPPVPGNLPRNVPLGGEVIHGRFVPEKTIVSVGHLATYRSAKNFHLPDEFIPERWLGDPRFDGDNKAAFQPFQLGPRNCIGRNLAYLEMRLVMARMLWNFDLELVQGQESWDKQKVFVIWEKNPLWVKLKPVARPSALNV